MEGGVHKGWNSQLVQWGAVIPTVSRAPGNFEYVFTIRETYTFCYIISIQIVLYMHQLPIK